jgi:hypothetical protein
MTGKLDAILLTYGFALSDEDRAVARLRVDAIISFLRDLL